VYSLTWTARKVPVSAGTAKATNRHVIAGVRGGVKTTGARTYPAMGNPAN
jgi:hypothetical protein